MNIRWIVIAICLLFLSPHIAVSAELKVTNQTNIEIYPTVTSGKFQERFGVVSIGKSATIGFSPFKLGEIVQISWEEGESYNITVTKINTSKLKSAQKKVASIHLVYTGNSNWLLNAYDKNDKLLGTIP